MTFQSTTLQILDIRFSAHVSILEFEQWLSQIERQFLKKHDFALVMQTDIATHFPPQYRQIQADWYKKNKTLFFKYCLGLARVAQNLQDYHRLNQATLHRAWRVPYYVTLQHTDALQWAVQRWI